jgi:hypothetical protein
VALVKKVLVKDLMKASALAEPGSPGSPSPPPADADLDAAFAVADADKSGLVDEEEFVKLMRLIKAGKVEGLGETSWFGFGGAKGKEKQFKEDLAQAEFASNAQNAAQLMQLQRAAAAGDKATAAEAAAASLAEKAKAALAEATAAQAAAAEKAAKAHALDTQISGGAASLAKRSSSVGRLMDDIWDTDEATEKAADEKDAALGTGPTGTIGYDDSEAEAEAVKASYANLTELLADHGLTRFILLLHENGVDQISELKVRVREIAGTSSGSF